MPDAVPVKQRKVLPFIPRVLLERREQATGVQSELARGFGEIKAAALGAVGSCVGV